MMPPDGRAALWRLIARGASAIVPLNATREGIPFYCVHSLTGEVTTFRNLARRLEGASPTYGIQAPKEFVKGASAASIEHISHFYVEELTSFQPQGELVLGGWSIGSVIAFEMAQQLRARGRQVALLVILDEELKNTGGEVDAWDLRSCWRRVGKLPRWIVDDLVKSAGWRRIVWRSKGKVSLAWSKFVGRSAAPGRRHVVDEMYDMGGWPDGMRPFSKALYDAAQIYTPKAYDGRVLVYAAKTQPLSRRFPVEAAWTKIAPMTETVRINGTHLTMVNEPSVAALAGDLRKRIDKSCRDSVSTRENSHQARRALGEPVGAPGAR